MKGAPSRPSVSCVFGAMGTTAVLTAVAVAVLADVAVPAPLPPLLGHPVAYVIITDETMAPEFQRLADWKIESGVPAVVKTLSSIQAEYPSAADDAERVRRFLQDSYAQGGLRWVLLGGGPSVVPARVAHTTFYGGHDFPTDLYYSCLDGDWNADGDAVYGEGYVSAGDSGDDVDLTPEVYVGRAPVTTAAEASVLVNKTIRYARDPAGDYEHTGLFLAETLAGSLGPRIAEGVRSSFVSDPNRHLARLYGDPANPDHAPGALPLSRGAALDSLDRGYNLALIVGQGDFDELSMQDASITTADVLGLTNGYRLTHLYDVTGATDAMNPSSIAAAFLLAPNGGGVTHVATSTFGFPSTSRSFAEEFFRLVFEYGVTAAGEAQARQKLPFVTFSEFDGVHRWTQMNYLLLGDPELRIWTGPLRTLNVTHPASCSPGDTSINVQVLAGATPLAGARVTLYRPGELEIEETDVAGIATLACHPNSPGIYRVTVIANDCRPYRATIPIAGAVAVSGGDDLGIDFAMPHPNPTRVHGWLRFAIPRSQAGERYAIGVFDLAGRPVRTLAEGAARPGRHEIVWNLRDDAGRPVAGGVYFVRLTIGSWSRARPLAVIP